MLNGMRHVMAMLALDN